MADPLSIVAGAFGIISLATTAPAQLYELISGFQEAPAEVQSIKMNLENIRRPLNALLQLTSNNGASFSAVQHDLTQIGLAESVNNCAQECDDFEKKLRRWTRHSGNSGQLSFRDKFLVGVSKKEKIRTFSTQLQLCACTIQVALDTVQLRMQLRSTTVSETSREATRLQLDAIKGMIREHLDLMNEQFESTSLRIGELESTYDGSDEADQAMDEAQKRAEIIQAYQVSCGVVFAQAESSRSGIDIGQVMTTDDSFACVGLPSSVVGKVNLRVGQVTTQRGSMSHVGVFAEDLEF